MKKTMLLLSMLLCVVSSSWAVDFSVAGNNTACYLKLLNSDGVEIEAASSSGLGTYNAKYNFTGVDAGTYQIVGYQKDQTTMCGKLKFNVTDATQDQTITVVSATTGISNTGWVMGTDWTVDKLTVTDNNATQRECEIGASTTANRVSILALKGDTYVLTFKLSDARLAQGYFAAQASATMTSGASSSSVSCEQLGTYSVTVDSDVELSLGWKTGSPKNANGGTHFIPLNNVEPTVTDLGNGKKKLDFKLIDKYYYIYNASMPGKRSLKGFFCFYATDTETKCPALNLTAEDFGTVSPKNMITDPAVNSGSNVADIIMNINEKGYLSMNVGEERDVFAQRNWQLINSIMNYYVDPDYHYEVINLNGEKDNSVITFDTNSTTWNPWVKMKAVGNGTAIVLVTYDACKTKIHSNATTTSNFYFNNQDGEWSALWPENTGVFVVTVGATESAVVTGMKNAEGLNVMTSGANKGKPTRYAAENVDAELDVFYYTEGEGYKYSFTPENAVKVEIAYPIINDTITKYNGFAESGVSVKDGVYTVILKHGTNIVRLQDAAGNYTYQVLRAKKAQYEITNLTREGMTPQAGDQLKIQFSGLYHPCNKLSGIYNMTGAIVYQGTANDNSIVGGAGQYNFGGTPAAQAFTISIPKSYDSDANGGKYNIGTGLLRVSGFGSAYGAHRYITRATGATPNMNAVVGTAYFGGLPELAIATQQAKIYGVKFNVTPTDATIVVKNDEGTVITPDAEGYYNGIVGTYTYSISAEGYKRLMNQTISVTDDSSDKQTLDITLEALGANDWDGITKSEPTKDAEGYYVVSNGAELAWIAADVNSGNYADNFIITNDFSLGSFDWTPIGGNSSSKAFKGECKGNGHIISDLYVNSTSNYVGLFGYVKGNISGITVDGEVTTTGSYAGGIAGAMEGIGYNNEADWRTISDCANHAAISAKTYAGGIVGTITTGGQLNKVWNDGSVTATSTSINQGTVGGIVGNGNGWYTRIYNAYNLGAVKAMAYVGGIAGSYGSGAVSALENVYNLGELTTTSTNATYANYCGSIVGGNTSNYPGIKNAYTAKAYNADKNATLVPAEDFANGEVALLLGEAFGQQIGVDKSPVLGGAAIYKGINGYTNDEETVAYELAVLTFDDADSKGDVNVNTGDSEWSSLIDETQYGGSNLYDEDEGVAWWYDENNTELMGGGNDYYLPYYSGGWAISNYYKQNYKGTNYDEQLAIPLAKSDNQFAVVYSYRSGSVWDMAFASPLEFADGKACVVESADVINTAYTLDVLANGNSFCPAATAQSWLAVNFEGTHADGSTATVSFKLADGRNFVTDWTKVDLTSLGAITSLDVYVTASADFCGAYGMNIPGYVAVDNIAVRRPLDLILADKDVYESEVTTKVASLTYTRTFGTTKWQPLYVPFTSDYEAWSEDVDIAEATSLSADGSTVTITYLEEGSEVKANTPYFIKAKEAGEITITVEDATLVPAANASVACGDLTFTGIYSPISIEPNTYYVLHSGVLVKTSNEAGYALPSMRWYVEAPEGAEIKVRVAGTDEATTIAEITSADSAAQVIYGVNGTRQQTLRKGVNIIRNADGTTQKVLK